MERTMVEQTRVQQRLIEDEMKQSYVDYAMSVIVGRALPNVKDGLKPVHRRILFAMHELGLSSNKPFKKCARIVGETLGKFHPHGDTAVYDSLVRMAQDFSLRYPLVNGHGNFGSVDGDSPAAQRYTEAKLQKLAEDLLVDIEKNTVDFVDKVGPTVGGDAGPVTTGGGGTFNPVLDPRGRTDRGDAQDVEPVVLFPVQDFSWIK